MDINICMCVHVSICVQNVCVNGWNYTCGCKAHIYICLYVSSHTVTLCAIFILKFHQCNMFTNMCICICMDMYGYVGICMYMLVVCI